MAQSTSISYRRAADRLLGQVTAVQDEILQRELLEIAKRYEKLASYAASREKDTKGSSSDKS